jgi:glycosyltransferase involved in cell wall biosynthesis
MKIGISSPYFDILGGGERYMLTIASHLSGQNQVDIFCDDQNYLDKAQSRFSLDLSKVKTEPDIFRPGNLIRKMLVTRKYDLIIFLTDGSIPFSAARNNILHFQVPFPVVKFPVWKRLLFRKFVCNSQFTKNFIDPVIGDNALVICPPVDTRAFSPGKKLNQILTVGRFSHNYQAKKQAMLIKSFRKLKKAGGLRNISLILAGSLSDDDGKYLENLRDLARGLPVRFYPNCDFGKLKQLYTESIIYWHAAGYGEKDPMHMEHFGITTVESMASGCIPVVYAGGGQKEIIETGINGFVWESEAELIEQTSKILKNPAAYRNISLNAIKKSADYDTSVFTKQFDILISDLINK